MSLVDEKPVPIRREEIAKVEVGQTTISPSLARFLVYIFLATIALIPVAETIRGMRA